MRSHDWHKIFEAVAGVRLSVWKCLRCNIKVEANMHPSYGAYNMAGTGSIHQDCDVQLIRNIHEA